jgi:hypothetical protein
MKVYYVTELQEQAMEMAIRVSKWSGKIPVIFGDTKKIETVGQTVSYLVTTNA